MLAILLKLLVNFPTILSTIHNVTLLVQSINPTATGPQKLDAAVSKVQSLVPAVMALVTAPELGGVISAIVDAAKTTPGTDLHTLRAVQKEPDFLP